ncbi:hypothetical protein ACIQNU_33195 [Streptomyces sp. NPDC091292]|uniref:hypothetical protein n=1 Tax=Streptomyces sp. NPDC091292 TaxID=3365991 RepID=UPI00382F6096
MAWMGRTSTEDQQDPRQSLMRQLHNSKSALPEAWVIVCHFYDVESGRLELDARGRKRNHERFDIPRVRRQALPAPQPGQGGEGRHEDTTGTQPRVWSPEPSHVSATAGCVVSNASSSPITRAGRRATDAAEPAGPAENIMGILDALPFLEMNLAQAPKHFFGTCSS